VSPITLLLCTNAGAWLVGWLDHERAKSFNVFLVYLEILREFENLCDKCLPWDGNLMESPRRHTSHVGKIVSETEV
jgi:hypothetical protein